MQLSYRPVVAVTHTIPTHSKVRFLISYLFAISAAREILI